MLCIFCVDLSLPGNCIINGGGGGVRCSSVRSWCDGSSDRSFMVDSLS